MPPCHALASPAPIMTNCEGSAAGKDRESPTLGFRCFALLADLTTSSSHDRSWVWTGLFLLLLPLRNPAAPANQFLEVTRESETQPRVQQISRTVGPHLAASSSSLMIMP